MKSCYQGRRRGRGTYLSSSFGVSLCFLSLLFTSVKFHSPFCVFFLCLLILLYTAAHSNTNRLAFPLWFAAEESLRCHDFRTQQITWAVKSPTSLASGAETSPIITILPPQITVWNLVWPSLIKKKTPKKKQRKLAIFSVTTACEGWYLGPCTC